MPVRGYGAGDLLWGDALGTAASTLGGGNDVLWGSYSDSLHGGAGNDNSTLYARMAA